MHNDAENICGESQMSKKEDLINAVREAFELAREFEAEIIGIGHICTRHNIRICKCQLGCFR